MRVVQHFPADGSEEELELRGAVLPRQQVYRAVQVLLEDRVPPPREGQGTDGMTVPGELKAGRYMLPDKGREEETPDGFGTLQVKADGRWHNLPVEAAAGRPGTGCRVYRISACYHHPSTGKYAYCEVTASHSDGSRCRLQSLQRHWWGWSGKIKLRWQEHDGKLYLQMRSRRTRRGAEFILYRIEMLWEM